MTSQVNSKDGTNLFSSSGVSSDLVKSILIECEELFTDEIPRSEQSQSVNQVISRLKNQIKDTPDEESKNQFYAYLSEIYRSSEQYQNSYDSALHGLNSKNKFFMYQSHNSILDSLYNLERYDDFLKQLTIAEDVDFPDINFYKLNYYMKTKQFDLALIASDEHYKSDNNLMQYNHAYILLEAGRKEESEALFNKLVSSGRNQSFYSNAINTLAFSLLVPQGRYIEAERVLTKAFCTTNERERVNAYSNLAMVALHLKELTAAKRYARKAIGYIDNAIASESRLTLCRVKYEELLQSDSEVNSEWTALFQDCLKYLKITDFDDAFELLNLAIIAFQKSDSTEDLIDVFNSEYGKLKSSLDWYKNDKVRNLIELKRIDLLSKLYLKEEKYLELDDLFRIALENYVNEYFSALIEYLKTPFADLEIRRSAVKSKNLDFLTEWSIFETNSEILHSLAKNHAEQVLVSLASNPATPDSIGELIIKRKDIDLDYALCNRESLSNRMLELLSESNFESVRKLVAMRSNLDDSIYRKLATDSALIVRDAIRENPSCSAEIKALAALGSL